MWELRAEGAAPKNNAPILQERFLSNSALMSKNVFTKASVIQTPIIKQLSGSDETEKRASDPIDMMQAVYRLETHLFRVGPLYLFADTATDQPWIWPGKGRNEVALPEFYELGQLGGEIMIDGTAYTDIRRLFSEGEISFTDLLTCLKQVDNQGAVFFAPTKDIPGPDGRPIYTVHSKARNIYSSEVRVEDMEDMEEGSPRTGPKPLHPPAPDGAPPRGDPEHQGGGHGSAGAKGW